MKFYHLILTLKIVVIFAFTLSAQNSTTVLTKPLDDDNSKYSSVGNIGLTLTNFGTYGHGFTLWPQQPNCEFPLGSGIEHIFDGGLWIGSFTANDSLLNGRQGPFVTTGAVDAASVSTRGGGFEFTNKAGDFVKERSSLLDSRVYSPDAVSHQDFVMEFSDTSKYLAGGELIPDHNPIGVIISQQAYSWNLSFANNFVIKNYWIKNVTNKYLDSMFVGLWTDAVVRNTNITSPRSGGTFFDKGGNGYSANMKIAYEFDATGDIGFTDSYIGVQYLGASTQFDSANFVSWQFRNTSDPNLFAPQNDVERYRKMEGYFGGNNRYPWNISPASLKTSSNRSILISAGPFRKIAPGDSINIVFAIITAKKFGTDPAAIDNEEQKINLYTSAEWALRAYYGEDRNRNGVLDSGEDLDGNGKITRYILPTPPVNPKIKVTLENQRTTIYWDKRSESSIDPITGEKDFEGYRLYRTMSGFDLTSNQDLNTALIKMADFDSTGNVIGLNTGFNFVEMSEPVKFSGDTTEYWYKFDIENLLNGWQYIFSVTAFDKGDETFNLESLESGKLVNATKIFPGTPATSDQNVEIGVYPNPYYANAYWDGSSERLRKIMFYNLPAVCEITIYTLAGDVVKRIEHDENSNGSDIRWFQTYTKDGEQKMAGGEHAWDLISDSDQAVATGLYLFSVKDLSNDNIKVGKFLIVK